jgi:hypothetical protein
VNDLQQRVLRALALLAMEDRLGEVTLSPEQLGEIDYQLMLKPKDDPPRLVVTLITRERFDELVNEGVPTF